MGTMLYEHNRIAYEAACRMMQRSGKAAVIHPTGTGKSFLAFQLCEEHPKQTVCWLSPSEYIFQTQQENWRKAGGSLCSHIRFYTYARLMLMEEAELKEIEPDYIVLDEYESSIAAVRRCGARASPDCSLCFQRFRCSVSQPPIFAIWITSVIWRMSCLTVRLPPK